MAINPYNYNTLMAKLRTATSHIAEEAKAIAARALNRAEEAYEYAEEAGQIANIANRLAEDIIYTHLQYDENATYSKMVYGINILGQEPENWLQDKRYNTTTGELEDYDNRICTDELISVTSGSKYIFSTYDCKGYIKQLRMSIVCYDADGEYVGYLPDKAGMFTVTIPSNTAKIGVTIFTNEPASSFTILTSVIGISILPWSVTPLEEDTDATYVGMYSSNEQEIPDETDPAGYNWKAIKTTEEGFTPIIPGTGEGEPGPPGPPGEPGATGVSITRAVFEYAVNNSTTTPPTSDWSETQPDVTTENPVLWQRIKTSYSDGTTQYTGTIPSVVFQRIVTFINAAQSGSATVINGGALATETVHTDELIGRLILGDSGSYIDLSTGEFNMSSDGGLYGIKFEDGEVWVNASILNVGFNPVIDSQAIYGTNTYTDGIAAHSPIYHDPSNDTYYYIDKTATESQNERVPVDYDDLLDEDGNPVGQSGNPPQHIAIEGLVQTVNQTSQDLDDLHTQLEDTTIILAQEIAQTQDSVAADNTRITEQADKIVELTQSLQDAYNTLNLALVNAQDKQNNFLRWTAESGLEISNDFNLPILQQQKVQVTNGNIQLWAANALSAAFTPTTVTCRDYYATYIHLRTPLGSQLLFEAKEDGSFEIKRGD